MTDARPKRKRRRKKKRLEVRRGEAEDVAGVVGFIVAERADRDARGASRKGVAPINADHLAAVMTGVAASGGLLVAEIGGDLVGHCAMTLAPAVYNPEHVGALVFSLLVVPEARGRGVGTALLDLAEECARESGASSLNIGAHWDGQDAARKYLERGHRLAESYYLKEI